MEVPGSELRVGDDIEFIGKVHRITDILPYTHPVVTRGEEWAIAYSRRPGEEKVTQATWGITIEPRQRYEIGDRPA